MSEQLGALAGLKVVELAGIGPGPLACTLLADLGADVLRVIRPGELAIGFDGFGRDRPALTLNLKDPAGRDRLLQIVGTADVLIEGFRPGAAERLGIGPEDCMAANPRLVYARMTGWGQDGPRSRQVGHDINYLGLTGALHAIGEKGGRPIPPLNLVADFGGGTAFVIIGILTALLERSTSGVGQVVDTAMVDGASYLMSMTYRSLNNGSWTDERGSNGLDGGAPHYRTYECSDGRHVAVGPIEEPFYQALLEGLDLTDVPPRSDRANWPMLHELFEATFATRTRDEWSEHFAGTDACVTPVLSLTEAPADPHMASRGTFLQGPGGMEPAPAPRLSRTPPRRAPRDDVDAMLADWGIAAR